MKLYQTTLECLEQLTDTIAIDQDGDDYSDLWNAYISVVSFPFNVKETREEG